jgi:signal transduction histidine kinase
LTRLTEDLLDVTRIRAGKLSFTFEELSVEELLAEVTDRFSDQLEEAGCSLEVELTPGLRAVWDRSRVEQVLVNLISNAIKYAPGGPIRIRIGAEGDVVQLVVRDSGPGIHKDRQAKVFERFERATSARNISGLGLGLFIASEIVKGHQGSIRVESTEGQGAAFIVQLPLRPSPVALT